MKKQILTITFMFTTLFLAQATVRTVSNHPNRGSQYSNLQSAYNAANAGDTLLLEGTNINYSLTTHQQHFEKKLTIIGIGYNTNTDLVKKSRISRTHGWSEFYLMPGSAGSKFYGIEFIDEVKFSGTVSSLVFEDCKFNSDVDWTNTWSTNIIFRNCIFDWNNGHNLYFSSSTAISVTIENCILDGYSSGHSNTLLDITYNHCVFLMTSDNPLRGFNNSATVNNCIFMNTANVSDAGTVNSQFDNNIFRLATALPSGNSGSSNQFTTDPEFIAVGNGEFYLTSHDYDLLGTSPGLLAGNDGTDIGVHGGTSLFSETGEVLVVPIMRSVIIDNTTIEPGGTLNVRVKAGKPNTD